MRYRQLFLEKDLVGAGGGYYTKVLEANGSKRNLTLEEANNPSMLADGSRIYRLDNLISQSPGTRYTVSFQGKDFFPSGYWKTEKALMPRLIAAGHAVAAVSLAGAHPIPRMTFSCLRDQ